MARRKTDSWIAGDGLPAVLPAGATNEWGGNLRSEGRPVLLRRDANGLIDGYSTTSSMVVPAKGGGYAVVPTVVDGKDVGSAEAYRHYLRTGEHWGTAATFTGAEELAQAVHERHEAMNRESWNDFISESLPALSPALREAVERSDTAAVREAAKGGRANRRRMLTASVRSASDKFKAGWYQDAQGNWVDPRRKKPVDLGRMPFGGSQNTEVAEAEEDRANMNRFLLTSSAPMTKDSKGRVVGVGGGLRTDNAGPNIGVHRWGDLLTGRERQADAGFDSDLKDAAAAVAAEGRSLRYRQATQRVANAPAANLENLSIEDLGQLSRNIQNFNDPGHAARRNQANTAARANDPSGAAHLVDFSETNPAKLKRGAAHSTESIVKKTMSGDTAASAVKTLQTVKNSDIAGEGARRAGEAVDRIQRRIDAVDRSRAGWEQYKAALEQRQAARAAQLKEIEAVLNGMGTRSDREVASDEEARREQETPRNPAEAAMKAGDTRSAFFRRARHADSYGGMTFSSTSSARSPGGNPIFGTVSYVSPVDIIGPFSQGATLGHRNDNATSGSHYRYTNDIGETVVSTLPHEGRFVRDPATGWLRELGPAPRSARPPVKVVASPVSVLSTHAAAPTGAGRFSWGWGGRAASGSAPFRSIGKAAAKGGKARAFRRK